MTLSDDQILWACALAVKRQYGDRAPFFVAEPIGALALTSDAAGIKRWKAIAARVERLAPR